VLFTTIAILFAFYDYIYSINVFDSMELFIMLATSQLYKT
jgi:hypothetical protein